MINIEKQKEHFKNHVATFTDYGNIKILDFKGPDTSHYRIRFLFEEDYCRLHISGDLGELIATNYNNMCYEKFSDFVHDLLSQPIQVTKVDYRIVKLRCQSKMQKFDVVSLPSAMINAVLTEENGQKIFDGVKPYITSSCHLGPDNSIVMESELSVLDLRGENK